MSDESCHEIPSEQSSALQAVRNGKNLFITGSAGTGKSHLGLLLVNDAEKNGLRVTKAAPTGIAAEAIGGCTLHRLLGLSGPLITTDDHGNPSLAAGSVNILLKTDVLFIDEISMVSRPLFDILAIAIHTAQTKGSSIQLIICGDFYQLPPVIPTREHESLHSIYHDSSRFYAFESEYWDTFRFFTIQLEKNYRQENPCFFSILDRIRRGDRSALPEFLSLTARKPVRNALWLCGRKADAAARNKIGLENMDGESLFFHAVTQGPLPEGSLPAPLSLEVKPFMPVIMTVNDPKGRFCNGSRGYVIRAASDSIYVSLNGSQGRVRINRYTWRLQDLDGNDVTFCQFPIIPAFALTVHRAQGLTLEAANILPYCWEPGQLYVMLSRIPDPHKIYIEGNIPESSLLASPDVKTFYKDLSAGPSLDGLIEASAAAGLGTIPSGLYRSGLRFGVYTHHFDYHGQLVSRSFIALRDLAGRWLAVTDFHRYLQPSRRLRPLTSNNGDRLYFITAFLNYLFIDTSVIDSLEDLTIEMIRTFLGAYATGTYGDRKRTSDTISRCVGSVIQFLLSLLEDGDLDLVFTKEDLFHKQYYLSRQTTLAAREALAFSIQYDAESHMLLRDMPQRAVQVLLSHIYAHHPDILLATALQLFAGLRPSEPLSIHEGCLKIRQEDGRILSVSIDLTKERILRDDGVATGGIKKHRTASVYPAFLQAFSDCYQRYREACAGRAAAIPSPLCLDSNGRAMTYKTYYRRFKAVVSETIPLLASHSDPEIREYAMILREEGAAPHIWRHVFTQILVLSGLTEAQIMNARGDSSPVSALAYLRRKSELMKQYSETASRIAGQMMEAARSYMGGER